MSKISKLDTKLKSDIAEYAVTKKLLQQGYGVLKPIGDRMAYDLAVDVGGVFIRVQVKSAWLHKETYFVDTRRTKTNRRRMLRSRYRNTDFDFAVLYIESLEIFYIMPVMEFNSYKSGIALVEATKRQRRPNSFRFREAWNLLKQFSEEKLAQEISG